MHLFAAAALAPVMALPTTLCGLPVKEQDITVSAYQKLEYNACTGGVVSGRRADDVLATVCSVCEKVLKASAR